MALKLLAVAPTPGLAVLAGVLVFLERHTSEPTIGDQTKHGDCVTRLQRLQSVTNGSFLEAQFSSFTYRSAVADGACIGP